jgi:hypothetical protein
MSAWREAQAGALDVQAAAIEHALAALEVVHEILEARARDAACSELRACCSMLRTEGGSITSEAAGLRVGDRDPRPLLVAGMTTRYPRRREPDYEAMEREIRELEARDPRDAEEPYIGLGDFDGGGDE